MSEEIEGSFKHTAYGLYRRGNELRFGPIDASELPISETQSDLSLFSTEIDEIQSSERTSRRRVTLILAIIFAAVAIGFGILLRGVV